MPGSSTVETILETEPDRPSDPVVEAATAGRVVAQGDHHPSSKRQGGPQQARAPPDAAKKKRKKKPPQHERVPPGSKILAYSVPAFCLLHGGMSEAFFWKLVASKSGPKLMKVGARTMISAEAAREWRQAHEATTTAENNKSKATTETTTPRLRSP
jgi:hypothetical protein